MDHQSFLSVGQLDSMHLLIKHPHIIIWIHLHLFLLPFLLMMKVYLRLLFLLSLFSVFLFSLEIYIYILYQTNVFLSMFSILFILTSVGKKIWPIVGDYIDSVNIMAYDGASPVGPLKFNFQQILLNFKGTDFFTLSFLKIRKKKKKETTFFLPFFQHFLLFLLFFL